MRLFREQVLLCCVLICICTVTTNSFGQTPAANAQQSVNANVEKWMADSGLEYRRTGETTWVANGKGRVIEEFPILVATGSTFIVVGALVAKKDGFDRTPDFMFKLLKLNYSTEFAKTGLDDDEDLFVRIEMRSDLVDSTHFKNMIADVTKTADEAYSVVKPHLKK
ncbi:MAG TPA: hypothetical protein VIB00_18575 [Pyrinomonadaceae bacterium]